MPNIIPQFSLIDFIKKELDSRDLKNHECTSISFLSNCNLTPPCVWLKDALVRKYFWGTE